MVFLTEIMPLSPFHIAFVLASLLMTFFIFKNPDASLITYSKKDKGLIISVLLLAVQSFLHILFPNPNVKNLSVTTSIMMVVNYFCYLFAFTLRRIPRITIRTTFYFLKYLTVIILLIEVVYRFTHLVIKSASFNFYEYKFGSIMYGDTNYVGIVIAFFIGFMCYLKDRKILHISKFEILLYFILCILTFSRAAIFGTLGVFVYFYAFKKFPLTLRFLSILSLIILVPILFIFLIADGSFLTKIQIYIETWQYILDIDIWHFFYGNGLESSTLFLSRYGHTLLTLYIIEEGVVGLVLLLVFLLMNVIGTEYTLYLIIPFILMGFSYMANIVPYFYLFLGIIYNIENYRTDLFNVSNLEVKRNSSLIRYFAKV